MRANVAILITLTLAACGEDPTAAPAEPGHAVQVSRRNRGTGIQVFCENDETIDTQLLQQAINLAVDGGEVVIGSQTCRVNKTLLIYNKAGLTIRGQGRGAGATGTLLEWEGVAGQPMFQICRSPMGRLSHLSIMPGAGRGLESAVDLYNYCRDATLAGEDTRGWTFSGLHIAGRASSPQGTLSYGIRVSPADTKSLGSVTLDQNNGQHSFSGVSVEDYSETAFQIEGKGSVANSFYGCSCRRGQACVSTYSSAQPGIWSGGSFFWHGGMASGNTTADMVLGEMNGPVVISGLQSSGSNMLLLKEGGSAKAGQASFPISLVGVTFEADAVTNTDRTILDVASDGALVVTGSRLGSEGGLGKSPQSVTLCYRAQISQAGASGNSFVFEGNSVVVATRDKDLQKDNPFAPASAAGGCLYPSAQSANMVYQSPGLTWSPMPQHPTLLTSSTAVNVALAASSSSRDMFILRGGAVLQTLQGGVVGQVVRLLKFDGAALDTPAKLVDARGTQKGNLYLRATSSGNPEDALLYEGDTITLMLFRSEGNKQYWYEVSRSQNSSSTR